MVAHASQQLAELRRRFASFSPACALAVAIERPSGTLAEALLAAEYKVFPIHLNTVNATRARYRASVGKSDRDDAYVLTDLLRTDRHRFQPLRPCSDKIKALRALVRAHEAIVTERIALTNRLTALLESFWPGAATLFAAIGSPIALAFLGRHPILASDDRLREVRMVTSLKRQRYSGRRRTAETVAHLKAAPVGRA